MSHVVRILTPAVLLFGFALTTAGQSQNSDSLKRQQAFEEIAKQRAASIVKEGFELADRMAKSSPIRAVEHLRRLQISLESEPSLPAATREEYVRQIGERIRLIEGRKTAPTPPENSKVDVKQLATERAKAWVEEYQDVKRTLDTIAALQKSGSTEQARREAENLISKYPNNPAVIALNDQSSMSQKLADAKILQAQQAEGYRLAMLSVDKAAIPPKDDIEFDTIRKGYFKEITKQRLKSTLTDKERELLKALEKPISIGATEQTFESVLEDISAKIGKPILLDKSALKDAQIDSTTRVNLPIKDSVQARTALRLLLQPYRMTVMIRNEAIQVVSLEHARENMITRVYYIGDIINGTGPFGNPLQWGPNISFMQAMENANLIVQAMEKIDPMSWKRDGGFGSATFHAPSMSIIVRQSAEVHSMLSNAFSGGGK
jgi:hypothetical protein